MLFCKLFPSLLFPHSFSIFSHIPLPLFPHSLPTLFLLSTHSPPTLSPLFSHFFPLSSQSHTTLSPVNPYSHPSPHSRLTLSLCVPSLSVCHTLSSSSIRQDCRYCFSNLPALPELFHQLDSCNVFEYSRATFMAPQY